MRIVAALQFEKGYLKKKTFPNNMEHLRYYLQVWKAFKLAVSGYPIPRSDRVQRHTNSYSFMSAREKV